MLSIEIAELPKEFCINGGLKAGVPNIDQDRRALGKVWIADVEKRMLAHFLSLDLARPDFKHPLVNAIDNVGITLWPFSLFLYLTTGEDWDADNFGNMGTLAYPGETEATGGNPLESLAGRRIVGGMRTTAQGRVGQWLYSC